MERNRNYVVLTIMAILGFVMGILYSITIIGLIIGIPMIMGAKKYLDWAKMTDEELLSVKQSILGWAIFFSIFLFPLGLLSLIPYFNLNGEASAAARGAVDGVRNAVSKKDPMQEKIEKIQKLAELKEKGLIDEEDFKAAKSKILAE